MSLLYDVADGDIYDGTLHNAANDQIQASFSDLGPLIISGLAVSIGVGLSVSVALGVASIGGRVAAAAPFSIAGLTDATTNHLYMLQDGTGTSNTTGTQPADSVKLGTALTAAGAVSPVAQTWASGRQTKRRTEDLVHGSGAGHPRALDISQWHATNNEGNEVKGVLPAGALPSTLNAPLTLTADDASQSSVTRVLTLRHSYNAGNGANGIGAGLEFQAENTAGGFNVLGRLDFPTTNDISANFTSKAEIHVASNNADVLALTIGATGDLTPLDGGNLVLGTGTGMKIGTATSQKIGFYGATPVVQITGTTDLIAGFVSQGLRAASGAVPIDTNGGAITAGQILLSGLFGGSTVPFNWKAVTVTPLADGNVTLSAAEYSSPEISLATGAWGSGHNLVMPNLRGFWMITNNTAFTATIIASGASVPIAAGKVAIVRCNAVDIKRVTADVTP